MRCLQFLLRNEKWIGPAEFEKFLQKPLYFVPGLFAVGLFAALAESLSILKYL